MKASLSTIVARATAFASVFAFYAHNAFRVPSHEITPIMAGVVAAGLGALAFAGFLRGPVFAVEDIRLQISVIFVCAALFLAAISTIAGLYNHDMGLNDWGAVAVEIGTPVLLWFCHRRGELLSAIGFWCVVFAVIDAGANGLDYAGIANIVRHVGTAQGGYGLHYMGASGNTLAEGLVALVAVSWLSIGLARGGVLRQIPRASLIALLLASLYLIGSRTYLALAMAAIPLIGLRAAWKIPPVLTVAAISGAALWATFSAPYEDYDERLRAMLMGDGYVAATAHPWLGGGVAYRDAGDLVATYNKLSAAGVTESGVLDFAIAFGAPAAVLLVLTAVVAASGPGPVRTWPSVLLALLAASLAFAAPLNSFLGSILFWGSLIYCQRDERLFQSRFLSPAPSRLSRSADDEARGSVREAIGR